LFVFTDKQISVYLPVLFLIPKGEIFMTSVATEFRGPLIKTELPGPKAKAILEKDIRYLSPSYTRTYPLVIKRGRGSVIEDVDGNMFLDFNAGVAVLATGHAHPEILKAISDQS
jgi:4-aminobutyrate aminotransferase